MNRMQQVAGSMILALAVVSFQTTLLDAQAPSGILGGSSSKADESKADPLHRETPRNSMYNFLQGCHRENLQLASQYLDTGGARSIRGESPVDVARDLCILLDRSRNFELSRLSAQAAGNLADGLPADIDLLTTVEIRGRPIDLLLQRAQQDGVYVWRVESNSVDRIPQLATEMSELPIEKRLPPVLVDTKLVDTPLWIWMTLVVIALLLSLLSRLLSRLVITIIRSVARHYVKSFAETYRLESFIEPLRLLLAVVVFRACISIAPPSALMRNYLLGLLTLLSVLAFAAILMRVADVVSDRAVAKLDARQKSLSYSVIPLFVRITKILIFVVAVLFVLTTWGYSTSTILAGVGVGGLAVALAAQKTIENLFGSLSIISDRPVLVGDFCQFGAQMGTVEDIGLRSTRIRTLDRTLVTIPNSVFSTMTLENYSRRDRMWFHPTFRLSRATLPDQIEQFMRGVAEILQAHSKVDSSGVPLRFTKVALESFDVEVFAYVITPDVNEFLQVQSELLLKIVGAATRLNIDFAVPLQQVAPALPVRPKDVEVDMQPPPKFG